MHSAVNSVEKMRLFNKWHQSERKLQRCCDQLDQLNDQLVAERERYERAKRFQRTGSQQLVYLRIQSLEGVRRLFYEYASRMAVHISALWAQIQESSDDVTSDVTEDACPLFMDARSPSGF